MGLWQNGIAAAFALLVASCVHAEPVSTRQPIIDMHRHTPWPGDSDAEGIALIREEMRARNVVAAALFITGREDLGYYESDARTRFLLSPIFPCPPLTPERKWCFVESGGLMPDEAWLDQQLAAGELTGLGELVFNYAGIHPDDPRMAPFWGSPRSTMCPLSFTAAVGRPLGKDRGGTLAAVLIINRTTATPRSCAPCWRGIRACEWFLGTSGSTISTKLWR